MLWPTQPVIQRFRDSKGISHCPDGARDSAHSAWRIGGLWGFALFWGESNGDSLVTSLGTVFIALHDALPQAPFLNIDLIWFDSRSMVLSGSIYITLQPQMGRKDQRILGVSVTLGGYLKPGPDSFRSRAFCAGLAGHARGRRNKTL